MRNFLAKAKIPLIFILAAELILLAFVVAKYLKQEQENKTKIIIVTESPKTEAPTNTPTPIPTETPIPEFSGIISATLSGDGADKIKIDAESDTIIAKYPYDFDESKIPGITVTLAGENIESAEIAKNSGICAWEEITIKAIDSCGLSKNFKFSFQPDAKNLPIISLYTDDKITSKTEYVTGKIYISGNGETDFASLKVKGRGNASWHSTEKKAYRLKLDQKAPILGLKSNRDYVLVSNYFDKSLIRNITAHTMAKTMENLYYTPTHIAVDLFLNGKYVGVYNIADKIEAAKSKVNLNEEAATDADSYFLIEVGWDAEGDNVYGRDYFDLESRNILRLFMKEPKPTVVNAPGLSYARKYLNKADKAIRELNNYEEYIDVDNFVDWFILAELTNNTEMAFQRSTYMYKAVGGKLCLGPVWDFDMAFGNHNSDIQSYDTWATTRSIYNKIGKTWMTYLVQDPSFMAKVAARWREKKQTLIDTANSAIDESYQSIKDSALLNFTVWDILNERVGEGSVDYHKYNTYELQVSYVKEFIEKRAAWIDKALEKY